MSSLLEEGLQADNEARRRWQAQIEQGPGDTEARALLLFASALSTDDVDRQTTYVDQLVWFVANQPDSPVLGENIGGPLVHQDPRGFSLVCDLYEEALGDRPISVEILLNYARFLRFPFSSDAIAILQRASEIEPENAVIWAELGVQSGSESRRGAGRFPDAARISYEAYLRAKELGHPVSRLILAEAAQAAGDIEHARRIAETILETSEDHDEIHGAHTLLGLQCLSLGDQEIARSHLLASAEVESTPVLGSFGPSLKLARAILASGDQAAVVRYLERCGRFWESEKRVRWLGQLRNGEAPDWDGTGSVLATVAANYNIDVCRNSFG